MEILHFPDLTNHSEITFLFAAMFLHALRRLLNTHAGTDEGHGLASGNAPSRSARSKIRETS